MTADLHNFTRRSQNLDAKLLRQGRLGMWIKYRLMRLSDLGREGIERSGSFRFADHIYRNQPSGRGPLGRFVDRKLLAMPASQAFRRRFLKATETARSLLKNHPTLRVLAIPCGLPRDMGNLTNEERQRVDYVGMDLDSNVLNQANKFLRTRPLRSTDFHRGDALSSDDFPDGEFDLVISTGLGEFLDDDQLVTLYQNVFSKLKPGGIFYTSATDLDPKSEKLLRAMELLTNYRDQQKLEALFQKTGDSWDSIKFEIDPTGLQTFVRAQRKK